MNESLISKAEKLVISAMKGNDASHDASHAFRVRDFALSLAKEEGLSSSLDSMEIVELAALLHDIGEYKYVRDPSEEMITERFLETENVEESKRQRILSIIKGMCIVLYKVHVEELAGNQSAEFSPEFGIARCFTFGGSRSRVMHDPNIYPRLDLSKEQYLNKAERAEKRHKFMEEFLTEFYEEWDGRSKTR
ncbi:hypothetical protein MKX01_036022 [Papaver californicum]|nr:hypothetical protein MKX01_036022 [Papaver californicum]